ncbi:MAG: MFS transporter, partial [Clostridia bacterium]|nr:MFS transporter [Clostridia bacterium]
MKKTSSLVLICSFAYFVSYLSRLNYSACVAEIIVDLGLSKTQTSYAVTGLFITYGIGQVFSGLLGDRFDPRKILACGLLMTAVCNTLMPLMPNVGLMTAVWCVNGVAQAMMFPPMSRIMAANMDAEQFKKACSVISMAASAATIIIYIMVPAVIKISSWRLAFYIPAAIAAAAAVIWYRGTAGYGSGEPVIKQTETENTRISFGRALIVCGIIPIIVAIIAQGVL